MVSIFSNQKLFKSILVELNTNFWCVHASVSGRLHGALLVATYLNWWRVSDTLAPYQNISLFKLSWACILVWRYFFCWFFFSFLHYYYSYGLFVCVWINCRLSTTLFPSFAEMSSQFAKIISRFYKLYENHFPTLQTYSNDIINDRIVGNSYYFVVAINMQFLSWVSGLNSFLDFSELLLYISEYSTLCVMD